MKYSTVNELSMIKFLARYVLPQQSILCQSTTNFINFAGNKHGSMYAYN